MNKKSIYLWLLIGVGLVFFLRSPLLADDSESTASYKQVDLRVFIEDVALVSKKTFLVSPDVEGKITISSYANLPGDDLFQILKDMLKLHGYGLKQTAAGIYQIAPMKVAMKQGAALQKGGSFQTAVITVDYLDATQLAMMVKPLLHREAVITTSKSGKTIIITDYAETLLKIQQMVASLDVNPLTVDSVMLRHISAVEAEESLRSFLDIETPIKIKTVHSNNSLLLEGTTAEIERLKAILAKLDTAGSMRRDAVSIMSLQNADGADLVKSLQAILPSFTKQGETSPTVVHEPNSNTIVISAAPDVQKSLESIIKRWDIRRPQVMVEAVIVEISDTASKQLGLQMAIGNIGGDSIPFFGTNFSNQSSNLLTLTGAIAGTGYDDLDEELKTAAVNSLIATEGAVLGGSFRSNNQLFSVILNAIEEDQDSNILSTPFVTTIDNVPARFVVGQDIPITTGESLGTDNSSVFRTVEREKIGIKLDVLPQISDGDVIRLKISQEVSSISGTLTTIAEDFVTNTREIETTVLADDGDIIVLGGLMQDEEQKEVQKTPVLGDLPLLGNLFRTNSTSHVRTNLMVFLRPRIIRNGEDARPITFDRYKQIVAAEKLKNGGGPSKLEAVFKDMEGR